MSDYTGMTTVAEQSEKFLAGLNTQRRHVSKATVKAYTGALRKWIVPVLGTMELGAVKNGTLKSFTDTLVAAELKPASVRQTLTVLKRLVGSELDEDGAKLWRPDWNSAFIDAPAVNQNEQNTPIVTAGELYRAITRNPGSGGYAVYYALAAGSGLRMGELLALRMGPDTGNGSFLDLDKSVIYVRTQMYDRVEQATKSKAGAREVDLCAPLVRWLKEKLDGRTPGTYLFQTRKGTPWHDANMRDRFEADGVPGSHSLRRFRTTHLENMSVPRVLVDYWTGHEGGAITDRYTKLGQSIAARKSWCRRAGLGFQLPGLEETFDEVLFDDTVDTEEVLL
jgi:integrase